MNIQLLNEADGLRTYAVVFDTGDEAASGLLAFARERQVSAASFTAIGALQRLTAGFFELDRKDYTRITFDEQLEVLSMTGNIALAPDGPKVHAHVVVGTADGAAHGGHLLEAVVRPTLEVIVTETPAALRRTIDSVTGLALISLPDRS
jgi:predicted DNA-binding protein with PD1-like motif